MTFQEREETDVTLQHSVQHPSQQTHKSRTQQRPGALIASSPATSMRQQKAQPMRSRHEQPAVHAKTASRSGAPASMAIQCASPVRQLQLCQQHNAKLQTAFDKESSRASSLKAQLVEACKIVQDNKTAYEQHCTSLHQHMQLLNRQHQQLRRDCQKVVCDKDTEMQFLSLEADCYVKEMAEWRDESNRALLELQQDVAQGTARYSAAEAKYSQEMQNAAAISREFEAAQKVWAESQVTCKAERDAALTETAELQKQQLNQQALYDAAQQQQAVSEVWQQLEAANSSVTQLQHHAEQQAGEAQGLTFDLLMAAKNAEASNALNRAQLAETQQAATRAQEAVANQNAQLLALQQRLASDQQQLTDLRASQAAAQAGLQAAHQQETASLQQAVEARDAQLHLAQQTEASLQQQLADRTTAHTKQAAANAQEIVALEKDAADNAMLLRAGQVRVKYVEDKLVQLRASLHQARADLEQQTAAAASREAMQSEQIWELQNTVRCHEASMIAADRTHAEELCSIKTILADATAEKTALTASLEEVNQAKATVQVALDSVSMSVKVHAEELCSSKIALESSTAANKALQATLNEANKAKAAVQAELDSVNMSIKLHAEDLCSSNAALADSTAANKALQASLDEANKAKAAVQAELDEANMSAKLQADKLCNIKAAWDNSCAVKTSLEQAASDKTAMQAELDKARQDTAAVLTRLQQANAASAALEVKHAGCTQELEIVGDYFQQGLQSERELEGKCELLCIEKAALQAQLGQVFISLLASARNHAVPRARDFAAWPDLQNELEVLAQLSVALASSIGTQTDPLEAGAQTQPGTQTEASTQQAGMQTEVCMQTEAVAQGEAGTQQEASVQTEAQVAEEAGTGSQPAQANNIHAPLASPPAVPSVAPPVATQFPYAHIPGQGDDMQPDSAASHKDSRGQAAAVAESTTATGEKMSDDRESAAAKSARSPNAVADKFASGSRALHKVDAKRAVHSRAQIEVTATTAVGGTAERAAGSGKVQEFGKPSNQAPTSSTAARQLADDAQEQTAPGTANAQAAKPDEVQVGVGQEGSGSGMEGSSQEGNGTVVEGSSQEGNGSGTEGSRQEGNGRKGSHKAGGGKRARPVEVQDPHPTGAAQSKRRKVESSTTADPGPLPAASPIAGRLRSRVQGKQTGS